MGHYDFEKDVRYARELEVTVIGYVCENYGFSIVHRNFGKYYDFKLKRCSDGAEFAFELKGDYQFAKTGNIAIEYESRLEPSGISVTRADYYIYHVFLEDDYSIDFLMPVGKLKNLVSEKKYTKIVNGGDSGSNTKFYLFPLDVIRPISKIMKLTLDKTAMV